MNLKFNPNETITEDNDKETIVGGDLQVQEQRGKRRR